MRHVQAELSSSSEPEPGPSQPAVRQGALQGGLLMGYSPAGGATSSGVYQAPAPPSEGCFLLEKSWMSALRMRGQPLGGAGEPWATLLLPTVLMPKPHPSGVTCCLGPRSLCWTQQIAVPWGGG